MGNQYDYLLCNGTIVTQNANREIIKDGAILIRNSTIIDVGKSNEILSTLDKNRVSKLINLRGNIVIPGLINIHVHLEEIKIRGFWDFSNLSEFLKVASKIDERLSSKYSETRAPSIDLAMMEIISSGITTICGGRSWERSKRFGIRHYAHYPLYKTNLNLSDYYYDFPNRFERIYEKLKNNELLSLVIFIHSLSTIDLSILDEIRKLMKKYNDAILTIHIGEDSDIEKKIKSKYRSSSIEILNDHHLLGNRTILVHCIYIDDSDLELISNAKSTIVHCPITNMRFGYEILKIKKIIDRNINICLASDGGASNNSYNLLDDARFAGLVHNFRLKEKYLTSQDLIDMITLNPARALNYQNKIASIEKGKDADLVIFDYNSTGLHPTENILHNLIYGSSSQKIISSVMVRGKYVFENNKFMFHNKKKTIRKFEDMVRDLIMKEM